MPPQLADRQKALALAIHTKGGETALQRDGRRCMLFCRGETYLEKFSMEPPRAPANWSRHQKYDDGEQGAPPQGISGEEGEMFGEQGKDSSEETLKTLLLKRLGSNTRLG